MPNVPQSTSQHSLCSLDTYNPSGSSHPPYHRYPYSYTQRLPVSSYLVTQPHNIQSLRYVSRSQSQPLTSPKNIIYHVPSRSLHRPSPHSRPRHHIPRHMNLDTAVPQTVESQCNLQHHRPHHSILDTAVSQLTLSIHMLECWYLL